MSSKTHPGSVKRLVIQDLTGEIAANTFAEDVRAGLTDRPKRLSPKYFYDELGSLLFEAVCFTPEYYLTRAETEILTDYADEIIELAAGFDRPAAAQPARGKPTARLIELGSGSAIKTRYLIEALLRRQDTLHYLPVDISTETLRRSSEELLQSYPGLRITAGAGDYFTVLRAMEGIDPLEGGAGVARGANTTGETLRSRCLRDGADRSIVLFLGSNIGNFDPGEARNFLRETRKLMRPGDALLLGADLKKDASVLEPGYNDALGITAAFNRNLLVRINRELGGDFDVTKFEHRAVYHEPKSRIEMYLFSLEKQIARIQALDLEVQFDPGESIHTENSYKFDVPGLAELAAGSGFVLKKTWIDHAGRFSFNLLAAGDGVV
jgi:L-histidine N-alpha-methyltransferase